MYIKTTNTVGLCIGVVFGTAATYFKKQDKGIMSSYMTGSAISIFALLGIRGLLLLKSNHNQKLSPLQHLKVLNYQSTSISSSISPNIPSYVHSRYT